MSRFTDILLVSPLADGSTWVIMRDFGYDVGAEASGDHIEVAVGFQTDFATIPRPFWIILPKWGRYGNATVIHDWLYCTPAHPRPTQGLLLVHRHRDQEPFPFPPSPFPAYCNRHAVPVQHAVRAERREQLTGREDADEVQGIGAAHGDELTGGLLAPHRAQRSHRLGKRVLLSREPAHEAAAPDLAPRLEAAVHAQDVAPRHEQALALHQAAEYDAVAAQQLPGHRLRDLLLREGRPGSHARPPPRRLHPDRRHRTAPPPQPGPAERPPPVRGNEQRTQAGEDRKSTRLNSSHVAN